MRMKAKLKGVSKDWESNRWNITFELLEGNITELNTLKDKDLAVEAKKYFEKRSGKANRLLWACCTEIAQAQNPPADKWDVYLAYIKRQGQCTLLRISPEALPKLEKQWRELEVVGHPIENGVEMLDVLCYFGSSTYNSREFSLLLDDIIEDMKEAGLPTPTSQEMQRALEELQKDEQKTD